RHARSYGDWSSDVGSSDLRADLCEARLALAQHALAHRRVFAAWELAQLELARVDCLGDLLDRARAVREHRVAEPVRDPAAELVADRKSVGERRAVGHAGGQ